MLTDIKRTIDVWLAHRDVLLLLDEPGSVKPHSQRKAFPQSRDLLRLLLTQHLPLAAHDIHILEDEKGKPKLSDSDKALDFNISHSGDYWACAISRMGEVGLDIEKVRSSTHALKLAQRFFTDDESCQVEQASDPEAEFFELWTRKEAHAKFLGCGIFHLLANQQVIHDPGDCFIQPVALLDGYKAALATVDADTHYRIHTINADRLNKMQESNLQTQS